MPVTDCTKCGAPIDASYASSYGTCRCGADLWVLQQLPDSEAVQGEEQLLRCLPGAGLRVGSQIDDLLRGYIQQEDQIEAGKQFRNFVKAVPTVEGERFIWAASTSKYARRSLLMSGGSYDSAAKWLLLSTHRLFIGLETSYGRRRQPDPRIHDFRDVDAEVRVLPVAGVLAGDSKDSGKDYATSMFALDTPRGEYQWREYVPFGPDGEVAYLPKWSVLGMLAFSVARRLAAGKVMSASVPQLLTDGLSAEEAIAGWLQGLGIQVTATQAGPDGGLDLVGPEWAGQVKMSNGRIGPQALQCLVGVAHVEERNPLFFSKAGYTTPAFAWAKKAKLPLFSFTPYGQVAPANAEAEIILRRIGA